MLLKEHQKLLNLHMGLVDDFTRLFNENLVLPDRFCFKKSVTLSLNIFLFKFVCSRTKKVGDIWKIWIFILVKRIRKPLVEVIVRIFKIINIK